MATKSPPVYLSRASSKADRSVLKSIESLFEAYHVENKAKSPTASVQKATQGGSTNERLKTKDKSGK